jgi:cytochrome c553
VRLSGWLPKGPRQVLVRLAAVCAWAVLALSIGPVRAAGPGLLEQGRRIYQEGRLGDGQLLRANGAGATGLSGQGAACVVCHRRSGMGSREGSLAIAAIAGPLLFNAPPPPAPRRAAAGAAPFTGSRQDTRAAYDDATLARALRQGLDSSGRALDALMPRYALGAQDLQALTAYLRQLSATAPTGLQGGVLHLASITTPDADPLRAATVRDTLQAWARSGTLGGVALDWQLWQLSGPPSTWQQQLQDFQQRQPVYAVLSGAGRAEWAPVRDFCEQAALPCLFPIVDLAPSAPTDFYSVYFSRGVPLEAQLLARHIQELDRPAARVIQLSADAAGEAAADLLHQALQGRPDERRRWLAASPASALADLQPDDLLVLWLRPAELAPLLRALPAGPCSERVYLSAQLAAPEQVELPDAWRARTRWVSARSDPQRLYGKSVLGLQPWAAHLQLALDERALQAEIYAATYFFADALARMRGAWNQDYLLETLENANFGRPAGAAFFTLSLAAGQREAAKGGHLLGYAEPDYRTLIPIGARLTP